jgi:flagellar protein FlaI
MDKVIAKNILKRMIKGYKKIQEKEKVEIPEIPPEKFPEKKEREIIILRKAVEKVPTEKEEKVEEKIEGVEIPEILERIVPAKKPIEKPIKLVYPLIPRKPKKGETIFAYAKIEWDDKLKRYVYNVIEPELTEKLKEILVKIKDLLEQRLDVDLSKLKMVEASEFLRKQISDIINYFGFKISQTEMEILRYFVERDFLGLGKIEPLMKDENIEDISCDGVNIPIFVYHRDPRIGSVATNIVFSDKEELDSFVIRLAQISGKSISVAEPLVDATLPDGSRLQATLGTDIARKGSNFTIRKFMLEPLTPTHLLNYKTIDSKSLAYLWLAVDFGRSILISGGTASGKTTLLNVLSLFIRPEKRIISIEDTAELQLPHPHWVPTVARTPISRPGKEEVDLFKLLKESIRQRPEYIIVGEVRGEEAFILFQQIATGHPSLATIHADTIQKLFDRLTTPPISLPPSLIGSLDLIVFLSRVRHKDKFVRKVTQILEMIRYDEKTGKPIVNKVFEWNPFTDKFETISKSILLKKISSSVGVPEEELVEELKRRVAVLEWMQRRNITSYKDVYTVITEYYHHPNHVLALALRGR